MTSNKHQDSVVNSTRLSCLATAFILLAQVGCASLDHAVFPWGQASSETPLTESEAELKIAFAKAAEQKGDLEQALSAYEGIVQLNLGSPEVHHRLALIYDKQGKSAKAEENYLQSLKENPNNAKVLCDYGYSLYLREAWDAAESQYRQAIKADPQYMRVRVNLGMLLARTDRVEEALHQFALGGLSEGSAHHNVALAAAENGDPQTAMAALKQSQQADRGQPATGDHHALAQVVQRMAARR